MSAKGLQQGTHVGKWNVCCLIVLPPMKYSSVWADEGGDDDDDDDDIYYTQTSFLTNRNIIILSLCKRIWPVSKMPAFWLWYMEVYLPRMMPRAMVPDSMTMWMMMMMMLMMMLIYCFVHHEIFNRLHWRKEKQWNANCKFCNSFISLISLLQNGYNTKLKVSFHNISKVEVCQFGWLGIINSRQYWARVPAPNIVVKKYLHYYHCGQ